MLIYNLNYRSEM